MKERGMAFQSGDLGSGPGPAPSWASELTRFWDFSFLAAKCSVNDFESPCQLLNSLILS